MGEKANQTMGNTPVPDWREPDNAAFQVGMTLVTVGFFFGILDPMGREGTYLYMGLMRFILFLGHMTLLIWSGYSADQKDHDDFRGYVAWNTIFSFLNLIHCLLIFQHNKPILLDRALQSVWDKMFGPAGYDLPMHEFYQLVKERAVVMKLEEGQDYPGLMINMEPEWLGILIYGEMDVLAAPHYHHHDQGFGNPVLHEARAQAVNIGNVIPFEFIDSYEKIARGIRGKSQVTIRASKPCSILRWDYKSLDSICRENPRLQHCIDAMVGQDLIRKFMRLAGRTYAGYDTTSDMLRKLDNPLSCVKKVGIREADNKQLKPVELDEKPVFEEIINSLRYANSRMLGIQCTPLETLNPIAGEPEKGKHYDRLVSFLNRSVKLEDADAQEIIKWGKFRTIRLKGTQLIRQGETPYHLGVVIEGRLDVSNEDKDGWKQEWVTCIDENELFGAEYFQINARKARQSIITRGAGVVVFQWDSEQLRALMQQDARLNTIVHRLLLDDHAFKQVGNQSWTTRMCGPSLHAPVYDHRMC